LSKILICFLVFISLFFLFFIFVISSKICPNPQHSLSTSKPQNPIRVSNHPNPSKFSADSQQTLVSIQHYKNRYLQNTKGDGKIAKHKPAKTTKIAHHTIPDQHKSQHQELTSVPKTKSKSQGTKKAGTESAAKKKNENGSGQSTIKGSPFHPFVHLRSRFKGFES